MVFFFGRCILARKRPPKTTTKSRRGTPNRGESWRIALGDCLGRATPVHSSGLGRTVFLYYLSAVFGAWLADVGIRRRLRLCACVAGVDRWVTGERVCLHTARWQVATLEG